MVRIHSLIRARLREYEALDDRMKTNAAKEIIQEIALLGLARSGFFRHAAFHGGTAFRIAYELDRFSEDLDFCLLSPTPDFTLESFVQPLLSELTAWGLDAEVSARPQPGKAVQTAFLKDSSLGAMLTLKHPLHSMQKLRVKLELDINPPTGAAVQQVLCEFPTDFYLLCHDLPTMFAGKLNAVLTRPYPKGRDWYDFTVYVARRVQPNLPFLRNVLGQLSATPIPEILTRDWLVETICDRIRQHDIEALKRDVRPFVRDDGVLDVWSKEYFIEKAKKVLA